MSYPEDKRPGTAPHNKSISKLRRGSLFPSQGETARSNYKTVIAEGWGDPETEGIAQWPISFRSRASGPPSNKTAISLNSREEGSGELQDLDCYERDRQLSSFGSFKVKGRIFRANGNI